MVLKDIVYFLEKKYSLPYPVHVNCFSFSYGSDGYCELVIRQTSEGDQILLGVYYDKKTVNVIDSSTGMFLDYKCDGRFDLNRLSEDIKNRSEFLESYQSVMVGLILSANLGWVLHASCPNYVTIHYVDSGGNLSASEFDPTVMAFRLNVTDECAEQLRGVLIKLKAGVINEQTRLICTSV